MKKLAATLIAALLMTVAEAQQLNHFFIDSLKHELTLAKEDTTKVYILATLGDMYSRISADTGVAYAQQALDLAKKLNFERGILSAEGTLAISLLVSGNYPLALDHSFKTLSFARKHNPLALGWANSLVSYSYYHLGDYSTCLKFTLDGYKYIKAWETPYLWRDLSIVYHRLNQPDSALLYAKKSYEELKSTLAEGNIAHILGDAYAGKANYDSALFLLEWRISLTKKL